MLQQIIKVILIICFTSLSACGVDWEGIIDSINVSLDPPSRKQIDKNVLGVNAFFNDNRFGNQKDQAKDIKHTLKINFLRVLFRWDSDVQPTPSSTLNFGFYDSVINAVEPGSKVLVIVDSVPEWVRHTPNPREVFVNQFVVPIVTRYRGNDKIFAWQIWNEPNNPSFIENEYINVLESPENYIELLSNSSAAIRNLMPSALVTNAATTSIIQNFPKTLDYNRALIKLGAEDFIDAWSFHFYGSSYNNLVRPGGAEEFLNSIKKPKWITESGNKGINNQLDYGERAWPFLLEKINNLERIYIYQYSESSSPEETYGLRNLDPQFGISDLYIHLRDN